MSGSCQLETILLFTPSYLLIYVQIDALQVDGLEVLVALGQELGHRLLVLTSFVDLLHEHVLLVELVETTLGDVLNHLLGHVGLLLGGGVGHDLLGLGELLLGHEALAHGLFLVLLGGAVVGVEASLLQGDFHSLLHLLGAALVDGEAKLVVDGLLRNLLASGLDGVHRRHLHGDALGHIGVDFGLVEGNQCGEHAVEVVVAHGAGSLEALIGAEFHLLAGDTAQSGDGVGHVLAVDGEGVHLVDALGAGGHSSAGRCRVSVRDGDDAGVLSRNLGFRLAL